MADLHLDHLTAARRMSEAKQAMTEAADAAGLADPAAKPLAGQARSKKIRDLIRQAAMTCQSCIHRLDVPLWGLWLAITTLSDKPAGTGAASWLRVQCLQQSIQGDRHD